ncbi:MAG: glycoside hydrolase family 127 protein [Clostridia bacterium]|nr:glycoside hydrolase family 127 protein [Clostridia bacterium]
MDSRIKFLEIKTNGLMDNAVNFVLKNQLKNRVSWQKTVEVFATREDSLDEFWRGEFFGKQMRGAALICEYTKDEELYGILTDTVVDLLSKQDELGRIATYTVEKEFHGWDMWSRKYVLVGMLYYLRICKDEALKQRIIDACKRHLDYILSKVGNGEGKVNITQTSSWWGCVNSCTILEPTLEIYKLTGEKRYFDFAEYIISTGGCSDCNLIELALNSDLYPYQYPVTKAYEMMSFYEGLLAYYEITGEKKYFNAVARFMDLVEKSDVTIIGCSGCTHELFDNSALMQTEYHENIMQETCVTVTWMRVNRRLFDLTGEAKYMNRFEISGYNALYGSLNTEMNKQMSMFTKEFVDAGAFDSYSPLYMNTRGRGLGGYCSFASGGYNGCCLAIGACGIALMPLSAVTQSGDKVYLNLLFDGKVAVKDKSGKTVWLKVETNYPASGNAKITVLDDCALTLSVRNPKWSEKTVVNGEVVNGDYYVVDKSFSAGETLEISMQMAVKTHWLNGKVAFTYGPLTLATDEHKSQRDLKKPVALAKDFECEKQNAEDGEIVRFECLLEDGDKLVLADYQSCGKKWLSDKPLMTVWFNGKN